MKAGFVRLTVALCGIALVQSHAVAQAAQAESTNTLDVVVTDKLDKPVADLKPEDFKVIDNRVERPITSVKLVAPGDEKSDPPVTAYLVVDMVNTVSEAISCDRALKEFLRQAGPRLAVPTSLIFFTDTTVRFQREPTRDPKVLLANLANAHVQGTSRSILGMGGVAQFRGRVEKSLQAMTHIAMKLNEVKGRKLILWIGPGWAAFPFPAVLNSDRALDQLFKYIVDFSTALRQVRITVYFVDTFGAVPDLLEPGRTTLYLQFTKGVGAQSRPTMAISWCRSSLRRPAAGSFLTATTSPG
jgi:VWFA-related protein